ncbi:MAG: hypothetical protein RLZZ196_3315 [Bacteroidota bacterium]|jgi:hypothetical protein
MNNKQNRIEELKEQMQFEVDNNFPNGDRWNELSDELDELQRVPDVFQMLTQILQSPKEY